MKVLLVFFTVLFSYTSTAQKIIGAAMADDNGITDKQENAKFLIVEKQINDTSFERLDYNFKGPIITRATFREKDLKTLNGKYADYSSTGYLATSGQYVDNKKDGLWYKYDDTSKAITKYFFHLDSLLATIDLDSLAKEDKKIKEDTTGEIEASYKGGVKKIAKIIQSNFKVPDRTATLTKGGKANVRFVINTSGKPIDIEILKSVEFAFDEESMRVISLLTDWSPASDKGKKVNAYRIQPIIVYLQ